MNDITAEHRGLKIRYSENEDVWRCYDLDLEAEKLSTLKTKIDQTMRADNKANLPALLIEGFHSGWKLVEVTATHVHGKDLRSHEKRKAYIKSGATTRRLVDIDHLIMDTPENRTLLEVVRERSVAAKIAYDALDAAKDAIPRLTEADFQRSKTK